MLKLPLALLLIVVGLAYGKKYSPPKYDKYSGALRYAKQSEESTEEPKYASPEDKYDKKKYAKQSEESTEAPYASPEDKYGKKKKYSPYRTGKHGSYHDKGYNPYRTYDKYAPDPYRTGTEDKGEKEDEKKSYRTYDKYAPDPYRTKYDKYAPDPYRTGTEEEGEKKDEKKSYRTYYERTPYRTKYDKYAPKSPYRTALDLGKDVDLGSFRLPGVAKPLTLRIKVQPDPNPSKPNEPQSSRSLSGPQFPPSNPPPFFPDNQSSRQGPTAGWIRGR